ncbi:hypothetical protein EDD73_13121 [Heliophilum fasciatum]|uniref:Uncharacterized protein n=1 Tax=Heliophilum fasciatum TaxID=35700 RepID=A0A4R2RPA4_9FIRM|nr:hypothetical protein [Heliophilum fasciatum]TCP61025.1 hypothetical protein EDD73_13121 [Heliophilum fasciatum]
MKIMFAISVLVLMIIVYMARLALQSYRRRREGVSLQRETDFFTFLE